MANKSKVSNKKGKVKAFFIKERVLTENSDNARELYNQSRYGSILEDGKVQLSLIEAFYLIQKNKISLFDYRNNLLDEKTFLRRAKKVDPNFWIRYSVYKNMRNRGYIIKTALKFGADFRVYARGIKPGEGHAKWIVYPIHESRALTWYDFAAKNRVAHSTKKKLLVGIVDDEGDVTYYEIKWIKP